MIRLVIITITCMLLQACSNKEDMLVPENGDGFPSTTIALPATLAGKWIRTSRLQTFDYKPDEWVTESSDTAQQKFLQLNANKTYSSNRINCVNCQVEMLQDTLYVRHKEGFYKFPVMLLNDSMLYLRTNIGQPVFSLPNTGFFDFVLEEKYRKVK